MRWCLKWKRLLLTATRRRSFHSFLPITGVAFTQFGAENFKTWLRGFYLKEWDVAKAPHLNRGISKGLRVTSGTDDWLKLLIMQLAGRHLRFTGVLFISRADNEGELKVPSFLVIRDKLWFCAPLQVWEHGRQKVSESKKIRTWVRCSGRTWREIGEYKGDLCKLQKEEVIHRTGKGLRSYWCAISLLQIMGK